MSSSRTLKIAQGFEPLSSGGNGSASPSVASNMRDGRFELYKVSLKYDNPEARLANNFPLDMQQKEVKEMMHSTDNTGKPFAPAK